jgi:hypothetical protein
MNKFYLMNSPELPTLGTHLFTTSKFMLGFEQLGFVTQIAYTLDSIENNSIVLLSSHGLNSPHAWKSIEHLAKTYPECVYICWFFHDVYDKIPFQYFVITGEHFRLQPMLESHRHFWNIQQRIHNYIPFTFACSLQPHQVGTHERNDTLNGCFIGTAYKEDWIQNLPNVVYKTGLNHGKSVPEDERVQIFLSSKIAFGFHSNENVLNHVVVERVFEGMAYGCVVISDSPAASMITDGIVQTVTNKQDFLLKYNELLQNHELRRELQQRGYDWIQKHGCYQHVAQIFVNYFSDHFDFPQFK